MIPFFSSSGPTPCDFAKPVAAFVGAPDSSKARLEAARIYNRRLVLFFRHIADERHHAPRRRLDVDIAESNTGLGKTVFEQFLSPSFAGSRNRAGISSVPISNKKSFIKLLFVLPRRGKPILRVFSHKFRTHLGEVAHPADIVRPLGDADGAPRVEEVEDMGALQTIIVGGKMSPLFFVSLSPSLSYISKRSRSMAASDSSKL